MRVYLLKNASVVFHHACTMYTFRRLLLCACFFVFLNLFLQLNIENEQRQVNDKRQQGKLDKWFTFQLFVNGTTKSDVETSLLKSPNPISIHFNDTFSTWGPKSKNSLRFTNYLDYGHQINPVWMQVTDDLYTYSAFWDDREGLPSGPVVRIVGILRYQKELMQVSTYQWSGDIRRDALNYSCFLWYIGEDVKKGNLSAFVYEEGLKTFVGTYFLCSLQVSLSNVANPRIIEGKIKVPYAVSLVPHGTDSVSHKLIYLNPNKYTKQNDSESSGVCVRPLFGPYTDLVAITQFISYYTTVLNISHFYFYEFAISKEVKEFLMLLITDGEIKIQLLPWNIPFSEWETLWDLGSLSSINDCIYRTSGRHNHVAIVDLDEFIVPRIPAATLRQLYTNIIKQKQGQEGDSLLVRNAFFCSEFQNGNKTSNSNDFTIFRSIFREARPWPSKSRSKMIVVPQAVIAVGHHMVHHFLKPTLKNQSLSKLLAILHHYRKCDGLRMGMHGTGSKVLQLKPLKDNTILKYKKQVLASSTVSIYHHFIKIPIGRRKEPL